MDIDCALSKIAAQRKGIESKKSGNFDLYILPDTNSSYFFSTVLKYIGKVPTIGVLLAAGRRAASVLGRSYEESNLIVAHLGVELRLEPI